MNGIFTENRISKTVKAYREKMEEILKQEGGAEKLAKLEEALTLDFQMHFQYQQIQSWAHASEILTLEEAQIIYMSLGEYVNSENGGYVEGVDLPIKCAIDQVMAELLKIKLRKSGHI